jgi:hypothetical protein
MAVIRNFISSSVKTAVKKSSSCAFLYTTQLDSENIINGLYKVHNFYAYFIYLFIYSAMI